MLQYGLNGLSIVLLKLRESLQSHCKSKSLFTYTNMRYYTFSCIKQFYHITLQEKKEIWINNVHQEQSTNQNSIILMIYHCIFHICMNTLNNKLMLANLLRVFVIDNNSMIVFYLTDKKKFQLLYMYMYMLYLASSIYMHINMLYNCATICIPQ